MQEFDPRQEPVRYAPRVLSGFVGLAALIVGLRVAASEPRPHAPSARPDPFVAAALRARATPDPLLRPAEDGRVVDEIAVAEGQVSSSLYTAAANAGASPAVIGEAVQLFSHKLDPVRDVRPGDSFKLVFNRKVTVSGRTVSTGELLYAEIAAGRERTGFYRFKPQAADAAAFFDAAGRDFRNLLLRTPLEGARLTSGFGMRLHPLLGYSRMHKGVDLGAPRGAPVLAASDGVVEEARWVHGYGRWLKIRHEGDYETGYGHLLRWAVRPGQTVHKGQVVAYVGSSGESTGPHLHFEVMVGGRTVDPGRAKAAQTILAGAELDAFKAEKAEIDRVLAQARAPSTGALARADAPALLRIALR